MSESSVLPTIDGHDRPARRGWSRRKLALLGVGIIGAVAFLLLVDRGKPPSHAGRSEALAGAPPVSVGLVNGQEKTIDKGIESRGTVRSRDAVSKTSQPKEATTGRQPRAYSPQSSPAPEEIAPWEYSEKLMERLLALKGKKSLTPEQLSAAIKGILASLAGLGQDALPAIAAYLAKGDDIDYDEVKVNERVFDRKTARMGLLEALKNIGGTEATELLVATLQNTGRPEEIVMLARMLEKQWPGEYQQAALNAAYQALARISQAQPGTLDVGPLFQVFADLADQQSIARLEQYVSRWPRYAATALAYAPDGAGLPGLVHMLESTQDQSLKETVVQLLGQTASRYPQAASALLEGIRSQEIQVPDYLWPKVAEGLMGNYNFQLVRPKVNYLPVQPTRSPYRHILYGNLSGWGRETVYITDVSDLTAEDIEARLAVIDQMLSADLNRAAVAALENARESLLRRIPSG